MINLTREKLAVNNIFKEKRSPPKNNRPPAQRACPKETTDRPALSKDAHVTCPEGMADCKAQEIGSPNKPTSIKNETGGNCDNCNACSIIKHRAKRRQIQGQDYSRILLNVAQIQAKHAHAWLYTKQGENSPHTKAPARERGIAWGACDKAASFGIANSFIVAPESQKRNL